MAAMNPGDSFTFEELTRVGFEAAAHIMPGFSFTEEDVVKHAAKIRREIARTFVDNAPVAGGEETNGFEP